MTLVPHSIGHPRAIVSSSIGDIIRGANDAVRTRGRLILCQTYGWNRRLHDESTQDQVTSRGAPTPASGWLQIARARPFIWDSVTSLSVAFLYSTVTSDGLETTVRLKIDNLAGDVESKEWSHKISLGRTEGHDKGGLFRSWDPEKGEYSPEDEAEYTSRVVEAPFHTAYVPTVTLRPRDRLVFSDASLFQGGACEVRVEATCMLADDPRHIVPVAAYVWTHTED